ncbi:MAG: ABC transporter ATP-binding protein [Pseudomonadota bacterium]
MQRFSYLKTGTALRAKVSMIIVVLASEALVWLVLGLLLPRPWSGLVPGGGLLLSGWAIWYLTGYLRRVHTLDERALTLHFGRHRIRIERGSIRSAMALQKPLAPDVDAAALSYLARYDTLYVVASRRGLVALELDRPHEVRVPRQGICQFSRIVLSLDDPAALVSALGGGTQVHPRPAPAPGEAPAPALPEPSGSEAIRLRGLVRRYGDLTAVAGIDLAVHHGEILAFLGANGAGKSTTIRMMTGLLRPTAGQVLIEGRDLWAEGPELRRRIGYVPDVPLLYESLTAREFLWLAAGLYHIPEGEGRERADRLLAQLRLERFADQQIRSFSLGMKRKMAIAAALIHQPSILLLDEVTNGLDPRAAREVKELIAAAAASGAAVFLTTHLLDVAQELAHRIALIDGGRIRALGTLAELRAQAGMPGAGLEALFLALTGDRSPGEVVS